ncbi:UDP-N-acetyl-alpha-D-muramoyl-L-alanyl-L-glutamate epimerase [Xanthomonadaceae bacterium JHOS43]|nr:UDP-N-acetyl-alpha-D-muramoyl-L-alanyl-L-glutamate epimerase [Xanthomonadaceae bacterium JHOS43]
MTDVRQAVGEGFVFRRDAIRRFRFVRATLDEASGHVELVYAFDEGPELVESLQFPGAPFALDASRRRAVGAALRLLHLIAGVSYYKAALPPEIVLEGDAPDPALAALVTAVYEQGLGEFAYRNGMSLQGRIRFEAGATVHVAAPLGLASHALTAIGGGKDSLVSIEVLRAAGITQSVSFIGTSPLIQRCAEHTGLPVLRIGRQLAPALFEFNKQGAWNGHIPVTAVNSAILVLAAVLLNADHVVFSNERSASYGSLIPGAGEVNHQWSKGWAFERAFATYVRGHVAADLRYYSLLRPLSELAVARQFAKIDRYDAVFSSCNRNFHLTGPRPDSRWCGICPKCQFVFLALAPFMPKPRLTAIFGRNLLDEPAQAEGFDALIEYGAHKPFECVGEGREARAAFFELSGRPDWREDALVRRFVRDIAPHIEATPLPPLLDPMGEHGIPDSLWMRILETFRS